MAGTCTSNRHSTATTNTSEPPCGGIGNSFGTCTWDHDNEPEWWPSDATEYGDSVYLDGRWDACASGDMDACDTLYYDSPLGSDYEQFGATCGGRDDSAWPGRCETVRGELITHHRPHYASELEDAACIYTSPLCIVQ